MTALTVDAKQAGLTASRLPLWRIILFRTGIVLTTIMAVFNTLNGGLNLLSPDESNTSPWIALLLFGIGLPTLLLAGTAWIPRQWALVTVIALRSLEALTMWVPFGPGDWYQAPENRGFYLVLVAVSCVVCALMAFGLRGRTR